MVEKTRTAPTFDLNQYEHLTLLQVFAALTYYHANRERIDAELAEEDAEYDRLAALYGASGRNGP